MPDPNSFVVPANAGTHTPCSIVSNAHSENFLLNKRRWLWVPAFACFRRDDDGGATFQGSPPSLRAQRSNPFFFLRAARWIASRSLSSGAHSRDPLARNDVDTVAYDCVLAARCARVVEVALAQKRAWGMPDAQCTRGLVCNDSGRTHTSNNEYTGITRHSRTQWF